MDHQPDVPLPPAQAAEELAAIVRSSPFAIFSLALDGTVLTWNSGTEQLYGISAAQAIGANFGDILPESMTSNSTWAAEAARRGESVINNEVRRTLADGRVLDLSASMSPIFAADGTVKSAAFVVIDVSPLRSAERRLEESLSELQDSVYRDHLTGVGSRELLIEHLASLPTDACDIALVLADVDEFQYFNQTFGHGTGDAVLRALVAVLSEVIDGDDVLARTGGDEFAVVSVGKGPNRGVDLARAITARLSRPITVGDARHAVTAGIGVATASRPLPGLADFLLRRADMAQFEAKSTGHGLWRRYDAEMESALMTRTQIEERLRHADAVGGEMSLAYQPLCEVDSGAIVEVEALLRWDDPQLGRVSPAEFIPVAEQSGLIVSLGEWVVRTACRDIADLTGARGPLRLNVNVSPRQLADSGFASVVAGALADSGLSADRLVLEITESVLVGSGETFNGELEQLRQIGVGLAVDDFGTGHSSLARLHALPFTTLKVDKSLIDGIGGAHGGDVIVDAVIGMAHGLEMSVVAEGVEHQHQLDRLQELGCDLIQGYLLHRPLSLGHLREVLEPCAAPSSR